MIFGVLLLLVAVFWLLTAINSTLLSSPGLIARPGAFGGPYAGAVIAVLLTFFAPTFTVPPPFAAAVLVVLAIWNLNLIRRARKQIEQRRQLLRSASDWDTLIRLGRLHGTAQRLFLAPAEQVFATLADPGEAPQWRGVARVQEVLNETPGSFKTWLQHSAKTGASDAVTTRRYQMRIWEPPVHCAWQEVEDPRAAVWTLECSATEEGALVTLGQIFEPPWRYAALGTLSPDALGRQISRQMRKYLRQADRLLPQEQATEAIS